MLLLGVSGVWLLHVVRRLDEVRDRLVPGHFLAAMLHWGVTLIGVRIGHVSGVPRMVVGDLVVLLVVVSPLLVRRVLLVGLLVLFVSLFGLLLLLGGLLVGCSLVGLSSRLAGKA